MRKNEGDFSISTPWQDFELKKNPCPRWILEWALRTLSIEANTGPQGSEAAWIKRMGIGARSKFPLNNPINLF